jgi:hypothetical protein
MQMANDVLTQVRALLTRHEFTSEAVTERPPSGISSIDETPVSQTSSNISRFSILQWSRDCSFARRDPMLRIDRKANGDVVLTLSGRLEADNVSELAALLAAEPLGRMVVLDLKDVVLVDRDTVRFLRARERGGVALRNCPPYIREWIAREEESAMSPPCDGESD